MLTGQGWNTFLKRVPIETVLTLALWHVISHGAFGVLAANAGRARINAFQVNACLVAAALGTEDALRSTTSIWITLVIRQARAYTGCSDNLVIGVWSARIRTAWIGRLLRLSYTTLCDLLWQNIVILLQKKLLYFLTDTDKSTLKFGNPDKML